MCRYHHCGPWTLRCLDQGKLLQWHEYHMLFLIIKMLTTDRQCMSLFEMF